MNRPADYIFPDRKKALATSRCMPPPIGCGGKAIDFRDEISKREYRISLLCQNCQDLIFFLDPADTEIALEEFDSVTEETGF